MRAAASPGLFSSAFLVGSVGGPVLGSLTVGFGLSAPFVIYGVALLIAAAVVFVRLRHSSLAAPEDVQTEPAISLRSRCATAPTARRCSPTSPRDGRRSGCAIALVPLFVVEVLGPRPRHGGAGAGDVRDRQRLGGDPQRLPVGPDRQAQAADRRADGVGG